ncbi:MAG: hypothetical protein RQ758_02515 [Methanomicrobiaceae archaeon]|nr:hypothetical protein [Methanomicrobiaceae archaeon]
MKKLFIPPFLADLVLDAVRSMDGVSFTERAACPYCGGAVKGHDLKKKRFARILEGGRERNVHVFVRRFYCERCGRLSSAHAPFYPDTRLAAPIVDFCVVNLEQFPYHHLSRVLRALYLVVDRGTIRNYAHRSFGDIPAVEIYGMKIPLSLLSISDLILRRTELGAVIGTELERPPRLPPADRAPPRGRTAEEGDKREKK